MAKRGRPRKNPEPAQLELPTYPSLDSTMRRLALRRTEVEPATQKLIDKWIGQLEKIQREMEQLQKIEKFNGALAKPSKAS